jgi:hypothetical protein
MKFVPLLWQRKPVRVCQSVPLITVEAIDVASKTTDAVRRTRDSGTWIIRVYPDGVWECDKHIDLPSSVRRWGTGSHQFPFWK